MKKNINNTNRTSSSTDTDFLHQFWGKSWTRADTTVDIAREPILVLDKNFRVVAANESFYILFQVQPMDTEQKIVFELGDNQWDIPPLRKLLEEVVSNNAFFKGFEITREFPSIGHRTLVLNARQIHIGEDATIPPVILLVMEDITEMMNVAEMLANHTKQFQVKTKERIKKLEVYVSKLEKEFDKLKKV